MILDSVLKQQLNFSTRFEHLYVFLLFLTKFLCIFHRIQVKEKRGKKRGRRLQKKNESSSKQLFVFQAILCLSNTYSPAIYFSSWNYSLMRMLSFQRWRAESLGNCLSLSLILFVGQACSPPFPKCYPLLKVLLVSASCSVPLRLCVWTSTGHWVPIHQTFCLFYSQPAL